jgi:hypothetical protein
MILPLQIFLRFPHAERYAEQAEDDRFHPLQIHGYAIVERAYKNQGHDAERQKKQHEGSADTLFFHVKDEPLYPW